MTLRIEFTSQAFPASYTFRSGILETSWSEILWAAITLGRPSTYHVFRHGPSSFHEAIFRLALIRMAVEQDWSLHLRRTDAFAALDPTEKGMVSYFLGMTLCKLFASKLLATPWLLHLDVFREHLNPAILGRSRPDLVGEDVSGRWHAFESKGRSAAPSRSDKSKAKFQALRLISIGNQNCSMNIGSFAFFSSDVLEFFWKDPDPETAMPIELPRPDGEWRYYYEPALSLATEFSSGPMASEAELADVEISIHPEIRQLLEGGRWSVAREIAKQNREALRLQGYQADGLKVSPGDSWMKPYEPRGDRWR